MKEQAVDLDQDELTDARLALCPHMEREAQKEICKAPNDKISIRSFWMSITNTDKLLYEDSVKDWHMEQHRLKDWNVKYQARRPQQK